MVLIRINEKGLEDAYWVMFLLCKPEDLSSDHQAPHKKNLSILEQTCMQCLGVKIAEVRQQKDPWSFLTSQ